MSKTLGDILFAGWKALGMPEDHAGFVDYLNSDGAKLEIDPADPDRVLKQFRAHYMNYSDALKNEGIQKDHRNRFTATVHEMHEKNIVNWAKENGLDERNIQSIINEVKDKSKWPKIYSMIHEAGIKSVNVPDNDGEWQSKIDALKKNHGAALREATEKATGFERALNEERANFNRKMMIRDLVDYQSQVYPLAYDREISSLLYKQNAENLLNQYHVTHSNGGDFNLFDLDSPDTHALHPTNGQRITIKEVFSNLIPEKHLKKQKERPTGGKDHAVITSQKDDLKLNANQRAHKARMEAQFRDYPG